MNQPKLCLHVRDAMMAGLEKAAANLHYTNSHPVIAFPCPCSQGELHPATVGVDQTLWLCSIDDDMCGQLEEKQQMWISSKHSKRYCIIISLFRNTYLSFQEHMLFTSVLPPLQVLLQPQSSLKPLSVRLQFTEKVSRLSVGLLIDKCCEDCFLDIRHHCGNP